MLLIQQATYPFILIFSPLNRRPHEETIGVPTRNISLSTSFVPSTSSLSSLRLSADSWSSPLRPALYFHPYCFSQQYSHFHPTDESGGYVSLSLHIVFYSTLLYSTLLYSLLVSMLYS